MNDDFRDMLAALAAAGARFLVVGAYALGAHGLPRFTRDLDIWVEPTPENARRVWQALARFGAPLEALKVKESDFQVPDTVVQLGLPPYRIDIMTTVTGLAFADAWSSRTEGDMLGILVPFIGRDAMVKNKRSAGRPQDLIDLDALGER